MLPDNIQTIPKYSDSIRNKYIINRYNREFVGGDSVWVNYTPHGSGKRASFGTEIEKSKIINAFPNPVNNNLYVEVESSNNNTYCLSLMEISGKFIKNLWTGSIIRGKSTVLINLEHNVPGVYFIMLKDYKSNIQIDNYKITIN
jgi:hypothetical protein